MYPILLNISDKKVVVIGGGTIALRKTRGLLKAGGTVTVVSPTFLPEFIPLKRVILLESRYAAEHICGAQLIFACTDSAHVNQQIVNEAAENQWVNNCGQKEMSDFFNMGMIEQDDCLLAFSSYGENPAKMKQVKQQLETEQIFRKPPKTL